MKRFFQRKFSFRLPVIVICVFFFLIACTQVLETPSSDGSSVSSSPNSPTSPSGSPQNPTGSPAVPGTGSSTEELSDYENNKKQEISRDNVYLSTTLASQQEEDIDKALHILKILRDEIVPQSVHKLIATFPKTFGWLQKDYEVGMGITLSSYVDKSDSVVALFLGNFAKGNTPDETVFTDYTLSVKYGKFKWNEEIELTDESRSELESHVAHEMMHALMIESLSSGFFGITAELKDISSDIFPKWFTEGSAEAVGGITSKIWDEITKPVFLTNGMEEQYVKKFIEQYPLNKAGYYSVYQTGCLATLYLSYLASGKNATEWEIKDLASGLDSLLYKIHCGQSLASVINEISPVLKTGQKKYSDITSFVNAFTGENADVVSFVTALLNKAGADGQGSLIAPSFQTKDILPNEKYETPVFWLSVRGDAKTNTYNNKITARQMFKGGSATKDGIPGLGAPKKEEP